MNLSVFYDHIAEAVTQSGKTLEEIGRNCVEAGITGIEVDFSRMQNEETAIMEFLKKTNMSVSCIYCFCEFGTNPSAKRGRALLAMAKRVGARKVLVIPGFIQNEEKADKQLKNMKKALIKICKKAKKMDIIVGMEDFDDKIAPFSTTAGMMDFYKSVPGLTCTFDTGNFMYSEEDVMESYEILKNRIRHVHLKDRSLTQKPGEEPKITIGGRELYSSAVGAGVIPMKEILTLLWDAGYDGTLAIEHFNSKNQEVDMLASAKWIKNTYDNWKMKA